MLKRKRINEYTLRDEIFIAVVIVVIVVTVTFLVTHFLGGKPEEYDSWFEIIRTIIT